MQGLNVPKIKAPNTPHFMNEYEYNNGYYFEHCTLTLKNDECKYIDFGCSGCLSDDLKIIAESARRVIIKIAEDYKKKNKKHLTNKIV